MGGDASFANNFVGWCVLRQVDHVTAPPVYTLTYECVYFLPIPKANQYLYPLLSSYRSACLASIRTPLPQGDVRLTKTPDQLGVRAQREGRRRSEGRLPYGNAIMNNALPEIFAGHKVHTGSLNNPMTL